jgi:hypothetical protein
MATNETCQDSKCGHDAAAHDVEGGFCNGHILTVLDTIAHCQCRSYDQWRDGHGEG